MKLVIKNARLISLKDGLDCPGDMLVIDGKIAEIGEVRSFEGAEVLDANGLCLSPGLIDLFTIAHEPEQDGVESLLTMSQSAAKGGYTTVVAHTGIETGKEAAYVKERAGYASCDIIPAAKATREKEILNYSDFREHGVRVVYNDAGVDNPLRMRDIMFRARKHGLLVMSRCRDARLCGEGLMREGDTARILDFPIIPASSEAVVVARDIVLSLESGTHVHLGHISTAASVKIIRMAKQAGADISCSTEPHYIGLDSRELMSYNTLAKLDPPLGNKSDIEALAGGLLDGTIDCLATGHTPVPMALKYKSLVNAAPGASALETALGASLTALYHTGRMSLAQVLDKMTAAPAAVLGIECGRLRVGDDADFALFDPDAVWICRGEDFVSRGQNTPYQGKELRGKVVHTVKAGRIMSGQ